MLPTVTPQDITLVQGSFALVEPIAEQAGALFYARLFELDPTLKRLFHGDLTDQSRKLMHMLTVAVHGLDRLETIVPAVRALGKRHAGYGVSARDFETVGAALLWTLERGLGSHATPAVLDAWATVYGLLTQTMLDAMNMGTTTASTASITDTSRQSPLRSAALSPSI